MGFLRTTLLLGLLTAIFLGIGYFFGGMLGMTIGFAFALILNFATYWFSDKIVLSIYGAKQAESGKYKELENVLEKVAEKACVPKPKLYIVKMDVPNAFATGRSPKHSAVAVTTGLMEHLNIHEIEGVLAHEIGHIKSRDTLVSTIAATISGAITWLGYVFIFGDSENRNIVSMILLFILAPIAAMLIRLAISRGREYHADRAGAEFSKPSFLADALVKIGAHAKESKIRGNDATAHMFIVNPFSASSVAKLFSTHPPIEERVRRLRAMANS